MKEYVSIAMMISMLEKDDIDKIHQREVLKGHLIANWNIQELLHLPTIKVRYSIPENNEALAKHSYRIENALKENGLLKTEYSSGLEWFHSFDWNIFNNKDQIIWEF